MNLAMRTATEDDLPRIVAIYNETISAHTITADTEPVTVAQREEWFHEHTPQQWPLLVGELDGQVVAWVSLSPYNRRPAYAATAEISVYIDSAHRGRHIGSKILEYVNDHVTDYGITAVVALIISANRPSRRLFAKFGYGEWGRLPKVMRFGADYQDLVLMGKRFDE
ncbi:GNAT family N-acetyltransferase [Lacticaseibacillus pabuli]|uniref:GNAT family N-acetyltransferase n=1 Tax=Lacticaseibacillus pabuli TaxID=3025672 RepID=A0ABY7WUL8_9LACO|nr:GNAT family N-acetyltransferase [Lacticaseibacillus sp. KACC 23028]WDF83464.1 GNAT family N-acetyltransferase [Lacticaseibacillus sp. KACC 23028]